MILLDLIKSSHLAKSSIFFQKMFKIIFRKCGGFSFKLEFNTIVKDMVAETFEEVRDIREDINLPVRLLRVRKEERTFKYLTKNKN